MAPFKKGDRVRLIASSCMSAPKGALATVAEGYSSGMIQIVWDRGDPSIGHTQKDGGYSHIRFELVVETEPTLEELAAEYRSLMSRTADIRKVFVEKGFKIQIRLARFPMEPWKDAFPTVNEHRFVKITVPAPIEEVY